MYPKRIQLNITGSYFRHFSAELNNKLIFPMTPYLIQVKSIFVIGKFHRALHNSFARRFGRVENVRNARHLKEFDCRIRSDLIF